MPQCLQQYLRNFFCHDITTCNVANSEMFWVNTFVNFLFSFIGEKINKGLRRCISFPRLKFSKHKIVWKQHATFLNRAKDDSKRCAVTKAFLALKGRIDITWNINCYCPLRQECGIECMNLNSKTDCIMLTMLERMRLTCCVLPQGKALEVPCIISYEMYRLPNI